MNTIYKTLSALVTTAVLSCNQTPEQSKALEPSALSPSPMPPSPCTTKLEKITDYPSLKQRREICSTESWGMDGKKYVHRRLFLILYDEKGYVVKSLNGIISDIIADQIEYGDITSYRLGTTTLPPEGFLFSTLLKTIDHRDLIRYGRFVKPPKNLRYDNPPEVTYDINVNLTPKTHWERRR